MKSWLRQLSELARTLQLLRPFLAGSRLLLAAVLGASLFVMLFEGAGVGLLVPLLNLLLGGENATPMRPIQWLERTLPGRSPAFYIGVICVAIVCAIAAKNAAMYLSQALVVNLSSSDTTEATVPATVTIAAGQASATFTVAAVDDALRDGFQNVTITASVASPAGPLTANGSFGVGGVATTDLTMNGQPPYAATAVLSNGKVLAAGEDAAMLCDQLA